MEFRVFERANGEIAFRVSLSPGSVLLLLMCRLHRSCVCIIRFDLAARPLRAFDTTDFHIYCRIPLSAL